MKNRSQYPLVGLLIASMLATGCAFEHIEYENNARP